MNSLLRRFLVILGVSLMTAVSSTAEESVRNQASPGLTLHELLVGEQFVGADPDSSAPGKFTLFPKIGHRSDSKASTVSVSEPHPSVSGAVTFIPEISPVSDEMSKVEGPVSRKDVPGFAGLIKTDALHLVRTPFRWDRSDWKRAGMTTLAVGGVMLLDGSVRDKVAQNSNGTTRSLADAVQPFGAEYSWGVLGGFYLAGKYFHNDKSRAVAQDGLASSLIAAGAITPFLKRVTERSRPSQTTETIVLDEGGASFPSGHTTQAFAVASVIASHYESRWVKTAAYGLAGLVGWARVENNAHFASDVVAGALIGTLVGKMVVRLHKDESFSVVASPSLDPSSPGVALTFRVKGLGQKLRD